MMTAMSPAPSAMKKTIEVRRPGRTIFKAYSVQRAAYSVQRTGKRAIQVSGATGDPGLKQHAIPSDASVGRPLLRVPRHYRTGGLFHTEPCTPHAVRRTRYENPLTL